MVKNQGEKNMSMTQSGNTKRWPIYHATTNELVAYHVRTDPGKKFSWEDANGNFGLPDGVAQSDLALYRNGVEGSIVVITEGEKDADSLADIGVAAWSTFGASVIPSDDALKPLLDKNTVVLWPDNDNAGTRLMNQIAAALTKMGHLNIKTVNWPEAPEKGDATDAIELLGADGAFGLITRAQSIGAVLSKKGSTYSITWANWPVTAEIRNPSGKRASDVKGQLSVYVRGARVHRSAQASFSTTSGMRDLRTALKVNHPDDNEDFKWPKIVEDISSEIIDAHTKKSPSVSIHEVVVSDHVDWKVKPLMPKSQPCVIWGDGSSGKSMFAQALAIWLSYGYLPDSDFQLVLENKKSNVLYLDYETDQESVVRRLNKIMNPLYSGPSITRYIRPYSPLMDEVPELLNVIEEFSIDTIIVDSLGYAVAGDLESAQTILEFFGALAQLECSTLVLSHPNKEGKLFGSAYIHQSARAIWKLTSPAKTSANAGKLSFTLTNEKMNDFPIQPAQGWEISFSEESYSFSRVPVIHTEGAAELSYKELVYEIIKSEGASLENGMVPRSTIDKEIVEIKAEAGEEGSERIKSNVANALSRLVKNGALMRNVIGPENYFSIPRKDSVINPEVIPQGVVQKGEWEKA